MADDLITAVDHAVGIYSTAPTAYMSALARVPDFQLGDLDSAIAERRLIRARTMRYSVYTSSSDLFRISVAATRVLATKLTPWRKRLADDYDRLSARVDEALRAGPLSGAELRKAVDPGKELGDLFSTLLGLLGAECRIVRAINQGGWRSNRITYARWEDWVDPAPLPEEFAAQVDLAGRYAAAYGPVTPADLRWWTGWSAQVTGEVAAEVDLEQEGRAAAALAGVRLLPVWDVLMVAYKDRGRLFDQALEPFIYDRLGNATSVVYDRGSIVGVWDLGKSDDPLRIKVAPLRRWPKRLHTEVEQQANRIGAMIGSSEVVVSEVDGPVDLTQAKRNAFLAPLRDA